jgi:hypothetical protein
VDIALVLDRIFIKFLSKTRHNATYLQAQQQGLGARSLLSTAARRLPEFIAEEQRMQDGVDEYQEVDMCDAYFSELEAHYAPGGSGWLPLREAVRAQGINLVSEMIHKGWVTKLAACRLLEECVNHGEFDAFEVLLSRHLATVHTYFYPMAFDPHRPSTHCDDPVYILRNYYTRSTGSRSFTFDELAKLLSRGAIPPEWMVTNVWKRCVDGAIKSLSAQDVDSAAAARLIEAVILSAGGVYQVLDMPLYKGKGTSTARGRPRDTRASANTASLLKGQSPCPVPIQDALNNLASSLITALCGMYIARSQSDGEGERATGVKVRNTLRCLAFTVQRAIGMGQSSCETEATTFQPLRRGYVLLGDCLLQCGEIWSFAPIGPLNSISRNNMETFFFSLASQHDLIKELAELSRQVVRFYEHKRNCDQTRTSPGIRLKVSQLAQSTSIRGLSLFLAKVAAETAMALAESTLDPDDHTWAVEVQQKAVSFQQGQTMKQSPASRNANPDDSTGLYRWEESISEWVASTPAAKAKFTQLNLVSKAEATRSQQPSTIACSTSSISASSSPSKDAASSVTSSAPSVSAKRAYTAAGSGPRSCKRLRSFLVGSKTGSSPIAADHSLLEESPIAARTRAARGALKELIQTKVPTGFTVNGSASMEPMTPKVEVVIVNKNVSALDPMINSRYLQASHDRTRSSRRKSLSTTAEHFERPSALPTASVPRRWTIPCSQDDDSDDELSFL